MSSSPPAQIQLKRGVLHLLSGSLLGRGLGFALNLALSRNLGPSGLGLFSLVLSTAQTFELTARGGVDYGLSCSLTGDGASQPPEQRAASSLAALRLVQGSTLVLATGLWLWVAPLGGLLPNSLPIPRHAASTALVLIASLEALGGLSWDLFLIAGRTKLVAMRQGVFAPVKLLAAWAGGGAGGAGGALAGYAIASALQAAWLQQQCQSLLPASKPWLPNWNKAWELIQVGFPLYATNALSSLIFLPLLAGVAKTQGIADVGYLRVGQIVVQLFTLLPGALTPLLFLRLRQATSYEQASSDTSRSLQLIWSLGLLSLLAYLTIDTTLVRVFFGTDFLPSVAPTRLLILAAVLDSVNQVLHTPLLAQRRTVLFALGQNGPALLAAGLGWWLIPQLGLQGFLIAKLVFAAGPVIVYLVAGWEQLGATGMVSRMLIASGLLSVLCWVNELGSTGVLLWVAALALLSQEAWSLHTLARKG